MKTTIQRIGFVLVGVAIGMILAVIMLSGVINRQFDRGRIIGRAELLEEAISTGNAERARLDVDARGYKWHVRKHSSQRSMYPNDVFIQTDM